MAKHTIIATQVLRIERETTIEVEAESPEEALNLYDEGEVENPTDGWTTTQEILQNESARLPGKV